MAKQVRLSVEKRTGKGKGFNRRLREQKMFPGIFYNPEGDNTMVQVEAIPFDKVYHKVHSTRVVELEIKDGKKSDTKPVLIWDVVYHPVKKQVQHVDFLGVDLTKEVTVDVPVITEGKAKGLENDGIVSIFRDYITVTCLPAEIPENISLDVTDLDVNDNINIEDIEMPEGVKAMYDENFAVVGVTVMQAEILEEEETEEGEEGEAEEGEETEEESEAEEE